MIVVDTNILAYLCLPGPRADLAAQLLTLHPRWSAPLLWRSEMRNILAGYLRRGDLDLSAANEVMTVAAECLKGGEHLVADEAVLQLVNGSSCSAYDCEFVALAKALRTTLVTEDKALLKAFPKSCRSLSEMLA